VIDQDAGDADATCRRVSEQAPRATLAIDADQRLRRHRTCVRGWPSCQVLAAMPLVEERFHLTEDKPGMSRTRRFVDQVATK